MQPDWPGKPKEERGTMAYRMTWVHGKMSLGMALPHGDTTRSSIHGTQQTEIDSGTSHDESMRNWVGLSTWESRSTALQRRMAWPQGCSSIN
jgi:hypothetical protein